MPISRFLIVILLTSLNLANAAFPVVAAETAELRGYGKVSADLAPGRAVFACETAEKADILLSKLLADLFWDKTEPHAEKEIVVNGHALTIYSSPRQGAALIARSGAAVLMLSAADAAQTEAVAAKESLLTASDVTSRPGRSYPLFLDFFDNRALKAFIHPMSSAGRLGLASHAPFLKSEGLGAAMLAPTPSLFSPAPGVAHWSPIDYEVRQAEQNGYLIAPGPGGGGDAQLWEYNGYPDHMMRPSDTTLLGVFGGFGMRTAGSHAESWGAPIDARMRLGLGFFRQVIERYRASPAVGGWYVFAGAPGLEFGFHDRPTQSWDVSVDGDASFRNWLREVRHYDLKSLGQSWRGDPKAFARWDDIVVPDINSFFGELDPDSFRLDQRWRWRAAEAKDTSPPPADAPGWIAVEMPPSQQQNLLPQSDASLYRVSFDAGAWKAKLEPKQDIWLVFGAIGAGRDAVRTSLNGVALATPQDEQSRQSSFAIKITNVLKDGRNDLVVWLKKTRETGNARLAGPVFLTAHEPKRFPFLGRGANARYADFRQWQAFATYSYHREMAKLARKLDADRPMILSGAGYQLFNYSSALAEDYGMAVEHTGREAWYHPWWSGLGLVAGFYGAGEESATAKGQSLDREFSWILFDADSSHSFFWDVEDYINRERTDGWFSNHRRLLQLFGKYLRAKPGVVLFRSADSEILGPDTPERWDIGRGTLQGAHYDNGYAGERELKAGLVDNYPALIDSGSSILEPDTVAALRKYVEGGGTFVALRETGLHTALEPYAFPIAPLTGFKPSLAPKAGRLTFGRNLPFLKAFEGRQFDGFGNALDCSIGDGCVALAKWADGSVAIGYRLLGKGRVIVLGSTFFAEGRDPTGALQTPAEIGRAFFGELLAEIGVTRNANASTPDVWARKMETKNGLQDWLLAINTTAEPRTADLFMKLDHVPDEVFDVVANAPVPFVAKDGGVFISNVDFGAYGVRVFGARKRTIGDGLPVWWREKTFYWKRTPEEKAAASASYPQAPPGSPEVMNFESWKFATDPDGATTARADWLQTGFNDASWRTLEPGSWTLANPPLKAYPGAGLYRKRFTLPQGWSGRRIILSLYSFDTPIAYNAARFFVNGIAVADYSARPGFQNLNYDVTAKLRPGENVLSVRVIGGPELSGLSGNVWLEAQTPLEQPLELNSGWRLVTQEGADPLDVGARTRGKGLALQRDFDAPAAWKGRSVYLELTSSQQWLRTVMLNGKPINYNGYAHPFGLLSRVNLTPYLKPGESNRLMLLSSGPGGDIQLNASRIGLLPDRPTR